MTSYWQGPRTSRNTWSRALVEQNSARLASAHHESGHVVAALFLRRPVHRVVVHEHGGGAMYQNAKSESLPDNVAGDFLSRLKRNGARLGDAWVRDDLMLTYCGPMAGVRAGGSPLGGSDRDSISRMIVALARDEDEARQAFDEAQARAHRLVDQYWPVIEDIALRLDEARELSGNHVKAICRRSVLGRRLLGEEEPMKYAGMGTLSAADAARQPNEHGLRFRTMTAQLTPNAPPRPETSARERRELLERLCAADGVDLLWFDEWLHAFVSPDPTPRGGKIFGRA